MTGVLAKTLDDLHDALWSMRPASRCIYEDRQGRIGQRWHGRYQWYKWDDTLGGYVWSGSTDRLGHIVTKWRRIA